MPKCDNDKKDKFPTGAQRDSQEGKPRIDLISPLFLQRLGHVMRRGADHYGDRNWEKGIPFQRCLASLYRHIVAWQLGKDDEDHLGNAAFNLMALMHYESYAAIGAGEETNTDISKMDDTQRDDWYGYQGPTI